jgi:hypothetical protein
MQRNSGYIGEKVSSSSAPDSTIGVNELFDVYNSKILSEWPTAKDVKISLSSTQLNETDNRFLQVTVQAEGFANDTTLSWRAVDVENTANPISSGDFSVGFSGTFTLSGSVESSTGTFEVVIRQDAIVDGTKSFAVEILDSPNVSPTATVLRKSEPITVLDTSTESAGTIVTGGTQSLSEGYVYHTFTSNGTLLIENAPLVDAEYLVVGGGGGSFGTFGGGGGAGGYRQAISTLDSGSYTIVVGAGGTTGNQGTDGNSSSISINSVNILSSLGGGRGGPSIQWNESQNGNQGGSGGGGPSQYNATNLTGGQGTSGQGQQGGNGATFSFSPTSAYTAGGGGGASQAGGNANPGGVGGKGGNGSVWLDGNTYAGGGGGGIYIETASVETAQSQGGSGGGGTGVRAHINSGIWNSPGSAGQQNTGGGAGGGQFSGGSGVVILRYQA